LLRWLPDEQPNVPAAAVVERRTADVVAEKVQESLASERRQTELEARP
jgi:hypothetical protein